MNDRTAANEAQAASRLPLRGLTLDLARGELLDAEGHPAPLRRQALEVLLALGRRAHEVVTKDELMTLVWPGVVVGDGSLAAAVADIRRALGDTEHQVVRNVARRGYLLMPDAPVAAAEGTTLAPLPTAGSEAPRPDAQPIQKPFSARAAGHRRIVAGVVLAAAIVIGAVLWTSDRTGGWDSPAAAARVPPPHRAPSLSIAILPFTLEGDVRDADWLADALHADLITELARYPGSLLIGRDTMATYKGKASDARQVARELGVQNVIRGSLRREGERIRLNIALVDGDVGVQRWSETFVADRATLSQTLGEFAVRIERILTGELYRAGVVRRAALSGSQIDADDMAMRGYALWYRGFQRENVIQALALFEQAVVKDPSSARAWNGVSFMSLHGALNGWLPDRAAALRRVEVAAAELDRIDRDGAFTFNAKTIPLFLKGDTEAMLLHTRAWTENHPIATAFGAYGSALLFNGHFDDAVRAQERALRLSPRDPFRVEWQYRLAMAHFAAGRYELAREWAEAAKTTTPGVRWPPIQAAALWQLGRAEAARAEFEAYQARHGQFQVAQALQRLPGQEPTWVAAREVLIQSLRQIEVSRPGTGVDERRK